MATNAGLRWLYEIRDNLAGTYSQTQNIDASWTNPTTAASEIPTWSAGSYNAGDWVRHTPVATEFVYVSTADSNSAEPSGETEAATADNWRCVWGLSKGWLPVGVDAGRFTGTYDGAKYTISNLYVNRADTDDRGLFGYVGSGGIIKGVFLMGAEVAGNLYTGGVAGRTFSATISECNVEGGTISGASTAAGGCVGYLGYLSTIDTCVTDTTVSGAGTRRGGVVGNTYAATATNCSALGAVTGTTEVGGIFGAVQSSSVVRKCYASGTSSGNGAIGSGQEAASIADCFWDVTTSGIGTSGDNNYGATGKTTAEMKDIDTFTDLTTVGLGVLLDAAVSGTATQNTITTTADLSAALTADDLVKITDGTNTEIHTVVSATSNTITISGTLANSYSSSSLYDVTLSAWDMVLYTAHDGEELTAVWYIKDGEDYPRLWYEWEAVDRYAKIAGEGGEIHTIALSNGIIIVNVRDNDTYETELVGERVYLRDFLGNSFTGLTDSGGQVTFSSLTPGRAYIAMWVKEESI
jgi:hypothetical protein